MKLRFLGLALLFLTLPSLGLAAVGISTPSVSSGELIRAADWNKIKLDLETLAAAVGVLQNVTWDSSGADTYYDSGNVGVGINSPVAVLDVYKDSPTANADLVRLGTSDDAARFNVDEDGDVFLDGKLVVRNSDIYETDGNLELSGEDSLYLSLDWNNNDADTNVMYFGKNDDGAGVGFVELMRLQEDGKVGIGTSNPASKLQVDGSIQIGADAAACVVAKTGAMRYTGGAIQRCDGASWDALATTNISDNLGNHTATQDLDLDTFKLVGNGGTAGISILATGDVGIGTAAPTSKLEVNGGNALITGSGNRRLTITSSDNTAQLNLDPGTASGWAIRTSTANVLDFKNITNGVALTVLATGEVGIGETSPDVILQVKKTAPSANEVLFKVGTDADTSRFSVDEDGDVFADGNLYPNGGNVVTSAGSVTFGGEDNLYLSMDWNNNDSGSRAIVFGNNGIGAGTGWNELARFNENGRLGINVITPADRLHVVENDTADRVATFENQATTGSPEGLLVLTGQGAGPAPALAVGTGTEATHTNNFVVTNEGKVGIGSINPGSTLEVKSAETDTTAVAVVNTDTGGRAYSFSSTGSAATGGAGLLKIVDQTAGQDRLVVDATGNVGIGTTSPTSKLHIAGNTSNGAALRYENTATGGSTWVTYSGTNALNSIEDGSFAVFDVTNNRNRLVINSSGNVGIGTTSPGELLTVLGGNIALRDDDDGNNAIELRSDNSNSYLELFQNGTSKIKFDTSAGNSYFDTNGNVGIGTTNPIAKLQVGSLINPIIHGGVSAFVEGGIETGKLVIGYGENPARIVTDDSSKPITFTVGGSEKVRILNTNGNVGIGTTSPGAKLEVSGETRLTGVSSDGTGKVVCVKSDGDLGTCSDAPNGSGVCTCS